MMSLTFGLFTQVSDSGPKGPLVFTWCSTVKVVFRPRVIQLNNLRGQRLFIPLF